MSMAFVPRGALTSSAETERGDFLTQGGKFIAGGSRAMIKVLSPALLTRTAQGAGGARETQDRQ